jgi:uncharacterized damage-inducible protein DinB
MTAEDIRLLYGYNRWANARALDAAGALATGQVHQDLGTSHRSVFGTLAHIVWAEWRWLGRWLAPAPVPREDPLGCADLPGLRARWSALERSQSAFLRAATDAELRRPISYENPPGRTWTYPLGWMMLQVVLHSTYHRGQVTALVRQLGAAAVATDFLVFIDEQEDAGRPAPP